jgi:hypothetical protein
LTLALVDAYVVEQHALGEGGRGIGAAGPAPADGDKQFYQGLLALAVDWFPE